MKNILFMCSRNQWRSPTAEKIYAKDQHATPVRQEQAQGQNEL